MKLSPNIKDCCEGINYVKGQIVGELGWRYFAELGGWSLILCHSFLWSQDSSVMLSEGAPPQHSWFSANAPSGTGEMAFLTELTCP